MTHVLANGTFDFLHPGHIHYLQESADLGDRLTVVIACDARASGKKDVRLDEGPRKTVVEALQMVDEAMVGSEGDILDTVDEVEPDIITLGHDQPFDEDELEDRLAAAGHPDISVVRISAEGTFSSSDLKE